MEESKKGKHVVHPLGMSIEEFRKHGKEMIDYIADYYQDIEKYPVRSQVSPGYLRVENEVL